MNLKMLNMKLISTVFIHNHSIPNSDRAPVVRKLAIRESILAFAFEWWEERIGNEGLCAAPLHLGSSDSRFQTETRLNFAFA